LSLFIAVIFLGIMEADMIMDKKPQVKKRKRYGQSLVEFALVAPMLLILIWGIMEFGRLVFTYSSVVTASREAARYGSSVGTVADLQAGTPNYKNCKAIKQRAVDTGTIANIQPIDVDVRYDKGPDDTDFKPWCAVDPATDFSLGTRVVVTVRATFQPIVPLLNIPPITLSSTTARTIAKNVPLGVYAEYDDDGFRVPDEPAEEDVTTDSDGDGLADIHEDVDNDGDLTNDDTDSDGLADYLDADDDGDTVLTTNEKGAQGQDTDLDGVSDYLDTDDDGDGKLTIDEDPLNPLMDTDFDGINDYLDPDDSDGAGSAPPPPPKPSAPVFSRWLFEVDYELGECYLYGLIWYPSPDWLNNPGPQNEVVYYVITLPDGGGNKNLSPEKPFWSYGEASALTLYDTDTKSFTVKTLFQGLYTSETLDVTYTCEAVEEE
jgi:Flp pilus assembly protein TadG